jgi:hypothetical protein
MLNRKVRNLAVTVITIVSATVFAALFATGASAAVTATPDSSTTPYTICSIYPDPPYTGGLGCISDPGHGNVVYVRFNRNTTLNLVYQETTEGYAWYLLRFNGTNDCLNFSPTTGFVYDDSCISDDPNEMWEHHYGNLLGNLASGNTALATCKDTGNSRLIESLIAPAGCNISSPAQFNWEFTEA